MSIVPFLPKMGKNAEKTKTLKRTICVRCSAIPVSVCLVLTHYSQSLAAGGTVGIWRLTNNGSVFSPLGTTCLSLGCRKKNIGNRESVRNWVSSWKLLPVFLLRTRSGVLDKTKKIIPRSLTLPRGRPSRFRGQATQGWLPGLSPKRGLQS